MYKVKVNEHHLFEIDKNSINKQEEKFDSIIVKNGEFHIIHNHKSYTATVLDANYTEKTFLIRVNNNEYNIQ
ncbi:MAG TPA: acetyl-CoA carboxylase biotin carboxyl carrier protein subunit, partial [Atribacterota bacterium]|nr:acetyl-CoA carboxylase biotin carboxyl carrier protein subunit [Atribacterota bacterium]